MNRKTIFRVTAENNEYERQGSRPSNAGELGRALTESQALAKIYECLRRFGECYRFVKGTLKTDIEEDCVTLWWQEKGNDRCFAIYVEVEDGILPGKEMKKALKGIAGRLPHPVRKPSGRILGNTGRSIGQILADFLHGEHTPTESERYGYMLLDRLKQDCDYFIGNGWGFGKQLWAGNVEDQIEKMRELHRSLPLKPEWLSMRDIDTYEMWMEFIKEQTI